MEDFKYYKDIPTHNYVWFKLLDETGKIVEDHPDSPCYGFIAHGFDDRARKIHIYHDKAKVPYSIDCIKRWITDINEMGFPCSFINDELPDEAAKSEQFVKLSINSGLEDMALLLMRHGSDPIESMNKFYNFYVDITKYKDKNHLFSTLSLIRCLTETGICKVPEVYFGFMDEKPDGDKFQALQNAHKEITENKYRSRPNYANIGHMVTFYGNGKNISRETLMARFNKAKVDPRDEGYLKIHLSWDGSK